jgi:hypothetical protein
MEIAQVPAYKRWSNRYSYAFKMEVLEAFQSGQRITLYKSQPLIQNVIQLI